jgi:hypothetical protein
MDQVEIDRLKSLVEQYDRMVTHASNTVVVLMNQQPETYNYFKAVAANIVALAVERPEYTGGTWTLDETKRFTLADVLKEHFDDCIDKAINHNTDPVLHLLASTGWEVVDWNEVLELGQVTLSRNL